METYQVFVGLLSTGQLMHSEVRLIHVNLLLDHYFQFDRWVSCDYPCLLISPDHTGLHHNRRHALIEGQRCICRKQRLLGVL